MDENRLTELIFSDLEGEISDQDKEDLHRFMDENPEAKNLYRQFSEITEHIHGLPQIEPGPEMRKIVMNSIDPDKYKKQSAGKDYKMFKSGWSGRPMVKIAYAFAIGIFAGAILSTAFFFNYSKYFQVDSTNVSGTIGSIESVEMKPVETVPIQIYEAMGQVILKSNGQQCELELDLQVREPVVIELSDFSDKNYVLSVEPGNSNNMKFDYSNNKVKIFTEYGTQRSVLKFFRIDKQPMDFHLNLSNSDKILFTHSFSNRSGAN